MTRDPSPSPPNPTAPERDPDESPAALEENARWITEAPLSLDELLRETADVSCGALVVFGGTVREQNEGREVSGMSYDAHVRLAATTLAALEREARERFGVPQCRAMHRVGALALGETSVYVVVRSPHRPAAFEAGRWLIDTLKERLPVWKQEHYVDGSSEHLKGVSLVAPSRDAAPEEAP